MDGISSGNNAARRNNGDGMEDLEAVNLAADWADISQGLRKDLGQQIHSQWIKPIQVGSLCEETGTLELYQVANPYNVIVPRKVVEPLDASGHGMKRTIVGSGAFKLSQAIDGQIYELVRNEKYFGDKPYLDKIQMFPIKGEVERAAALQSGRIHGCFFFANEAVLAGLRKQPSISAFRRPTPMLT